MPVLTGEPIAIGMTPGCGKSRRWGERLPLRPAPRRPLLLDLSRLVFADPLYLVRLRAFIDCHAGRGHAVEVVPPTSREVCNYLARMGLTDDLPASCSFSLSQVRVRDLPDILIPLTRLQDTMEAGLLDDKVGELLQAHFPGQLAHLGDAFAAAIGELTDNATTHGQSEHGTYIAAQRYEESRCVLAIADLGVGIPAHIRRAYPHLTDDGDAIADATRAAITASTPKSKRSHRGYGYEHLIDEMLVTNVPYGSLRIWSGSGRFNLTVIDGHTQQRRGWKSEATAGASIRVELRTG
jgi:hypothetical protein